MDSVLGFVIALVVVLLIAKLLFKTTKAIIGFLVNAVVGYVILMILNFFNLGIPVTWVTTAIVGFLGVPGIILVLLLKFVFGVL